MYVNQSNPSQMFSDFTLLFSKMILSSSVTYSNVDNSALLGSMNNKTYKYSGSNHQILIQTKTCMFFLYLQTFYSLQYIFDIFFIYL